MVKYATAEDFAKWQNKAKTMTWPELQYAITDCRKASMAQADNEGFYLDQASTFREELMRRTPETGR